MNKRDVGFYLLVESQNYYRYVIDEGHYSSNRNEASVFKTFNEALTMYKKHYEGGSFTIGRITAGNICRVGPKICYEYIGKSSGQRYVWSDDPKMDITKGYGDLPPYKT